MAVTPTLVVYQATGTTTDFVFPFAYLDSDHIAVTVDGVSRSFTLISQNTVRISPAPSGEVRIARETPGDALVVWNDGAVILGKDLNTSSTQPRYIAEEARDIAEEALVVARTNVDAALEAVADARTAASQADTSKTAAAASQTSAATSATTATTKAAEASASATAAAASLGSVTAAATTATTKAGEASASATAAQASATQAATSATTATTKASEATASATTATTKAGEAAASATAAATSAAQAQATQVAIEAVYDSFDDRYLGMKPSAPTVDNDGGALQIGALYFDTTSQQLFIRTASGWLAAYIPSTNAVSSFNGRTGAVVSASGDYAVAQITGLQTALDAKANDNTALKANVEDQTITGGARTPHKSMGSFSSGTFTPDPGDGPMQFITQNGSFTLAEPTQQGSILLLIWAPVAGTITFSGFDKVEGDTPGTANSAHLVFIYKIESISYALVKKIW